MPNTESLQLCKKNKDAAAGGTDVTAASEALPQKPDQVFMRSFYREERWMIWDNLITAGRRELSACLVKGVRYTFSAAVLRRAHLPPLTFSRGLESWRCCQPSHRIWCWQQLVQQKTKRYETAENNCTYQWGLKCFTTHLSCQTRTMRSLGLREIPLWMHKFVQIFSFLQSGVM